MDLGGPSAGHRLPPRSEGQGVDQQVSIGTCQLGGPGFP